MQAGGVSTLLNSDDPVERRLALKAKACTPADLRRGLQDEDPDVRLAAAKHPHLTPELIQEILRGPDRWLAQQTLSRSDLSPQDLGVALLQEDLRSQALEHPRLTEEHRNRLADDPEVPEGLRDAALRKNIGFITFPHLGEGRVHNPGAYFPEGGYGEHKLWATRGKGSVSLGERGATIYRSGQTKGINPADGKMTLIARKPDDGPKPETGSMNAAVRRRMFGELPGNLLGDLQGRLDSLRAVKEQRGPVLQTMANKAAQATSDHEAQHGIFARLSQRYGHEARNQIVKAALRRLPNDLRSHYKHLFSGFRTAYDPEMHPEESIAFLQNYLQDSTHRQKVHVHLRISKDPEAQRISVAGARKTWQALQRIGGSLKPEDVGLPKPIPEQERIKQWKDRLSKSRNLGMDQLGYSEEVESVKAALLFLTGKPVDGAVFRARLIDCDGDVKSAGLAAAGLPESSKPALEALLKVRGMRKALDDWQPKIESLMPESDEVASDLARAFKTQDVEAVKLGGKHSRGTLLAKDKDGNLMLVKPGSGKQSPAAGAGEEPASQSRREAAFHSLASAWGFDDVVPRADLVSLDGRETAVIRMLGLDWTGLARAQTQNPGLARQVLRRYVDDGSCHAWAVLDYVAGNPDRHGNNLMVGPEIGGQHDVALIDHGSAFAGDSFDPGRDQNSFVPYYLRVWGPDTGWNRLSPGDRLRALPTLSKPTDDRLKGWISSLDPAELTRVLQRYGINPSPELKRLRQVKSCIDAGNASVALNALWLT